MWQQYDVNLCTPVLGPTEVMQLGDDSCLGVRAGACSKLFFAASGTGSTPCICSYASTLTYSPMVSTAWPQVEFASKKRPLAELAVC